ncbi:MAG: phage tail protein [Parvularcula sp.]|jgi:hypothetical protein|nr:phage tail protein [Parvularcula sp.]
MATLLLTAVGSAIGGPIGGAIGAFLGRQADQAILGFGRQGARLKELSVTTSSYGQPLPRNFGRMRVAGTIIWSTELKESSNNGSGGKGQGSTAGYSYSASFAVALSSTPIDRIGRIWADGNLLRGAAGDLKVAGAMRLYPGTGDHNVDPLIAADRGHLAPAFRDTAYVVFENLQLADFGNRIPALTFEVFAADDQTVTLAQLVPGVQAEESAVVLRDARGFSDEGGAIGSTLAAVDQVFPLTCTTTPKGLRLASMYSPAGPIPVLPEQVSVRRSQEADERHKRRGEQAGEEPLALRYYDEDRDYLPSVQRALGLRPDGREIMVDLPAAMNSQGARSLANSNAQRARWRNERLTWRVGELDAEIAPGNFVRLPDNSGLWLVRSWEWSDLGIELELDRIAPEVAGHLTGDAGSSNPPKDLLVTPTQLFATELPPEDGANPVSRHLFAAATSASPGWRGATLFAEQGETLLQLGATGSQRAVAGVLAAPLEPSTCHLIEPNATLLINLAAGDLAFTNTDLVGLANGANRLMVGGELIQFLNAEPLGDKRWRLSGLLRGRAGTEPAASSEHALGTTAILLDDALTMLDPSKIAVAHPLRIAAIGVGDDEPVYADLQNTGLSRRPIMPVAPIASVGSAGELHLRWTRRGRGQWTWPDGVEVPLVEERELYAVGYGPSDAPHALWLVEQAEISLSIEEHSGLLTAYGPGTLWVKQVGSFGESPALTLTTFS